MEEQQVQELTNSAKLDSTEEATVVEKEIEVPNFTNVKQFLSGTETPYPQPDMNYHRIAVAPMIDITDVHFRNLMRLFTRYSILYTEMIHEQAIHHNVRGPEEFLRFDPVQHPVVIQLGGNDPIKLASAAKICEEIGYDEVNLNVGCPSDRVQSGKFGACLMKEPENVAVMMKKLQESCSIPCTVKCRLGVDDFDSYEFARDFVKIVSEQGGVQHFIVHARKALLKGLSPAQNRMIPPLKYDYVERLKAEFPHLTISINGGFKTYEQIDAILSPEKGIHGCMIGRSAYESPWLFSDMDRRYYGKPNPGYSRREILQIWGKYGKYVLERNPNVCIPTLNKPIIHLFAGEKSATRYRHFLSDRSNFKKYGDYEHYILQAIKEFEPYNKQCLDLRPVGSESADTSIADSLLDSVKELKSEEQPEIIDSQVMEQV